MDINTIKTKLLIKYPTFGSIIANIQFQENNNIKTVRTDGKVIQYNNNFLSKLTQQEQTFLFAHEICHIAFDHIYRSEGKDSKIWNKATDAVINALLQQDGLPLVKGGIDIKEAVNYNAEEMYEKLLKEKKQNSKQNKNGKGEKDVRARGTVPTKRTRRNIRARRTRRYRHGIRNT